MVKLVWWFGDGRTWGGKKKEIDFSGQLVGFGAMTVEAEVQAWEGSALSNPPGALFNLWLQR